MNEPKLAIGFDENGYIWSMEVYSRDPYTVYAQLREKSGGGWPSQILLIKDNEVIAHWNEGKDYEI